MKKRKTKLAVFLLAAAPAIILSHDPLVADELSELYLDSTSGDTSSGIGPNILIILDTSGSMTKNDLPFDVDPEKFWGAPYDPLTTYPGPCDDDYVYRKSFDMDRNGDGIVNDLDVTEDDFQSCNNSIRFPRTALACEKVKVNGFAVDNFGEFRPRVPGPDGDYTFGLEDEALDGEWHSLDGDFNEVASVDGIMVWRECASEAGIHGYASSGAASYYKYPQNSGDEFGWTGDAAEATDLGTMQRQLVATGSYINYYRWAQTRLAAVQAALREVIAELPPETRVGVMRFDVKIEAEGEGSSDGGYMIQEFVELGENSTDSGGNLVLSANRQAVIDAIFGIDPAGDGGTPLGEALYEALQVFRGEAVTFGEDAERWLIDTWVFPWEESPASTKKDNTYDYTDDTSVAASRSATDPSKYESPIEYQCQKNAIILLSDGDPNGDKNTWGYFKNLPNASTYAPSDCDDDSSEYPSCLREVAEYLANEDLIPDAILPGQQSVNTHTVGFGDDISSTGTALLTETAERGGGSYTHANNYEELKEAFKVIFREEIAENASLSSPAVTVNAFNRMQHEDALYFTMFDPIFDSVHWPGNLKKYRLAKDENGDYRITDANGQPALVDGTSALRPDALSFWTNPADPEIVANSGVDGNKTALGGAAGELNDNYVLNERKIYTWIEGETSKQLTADPENLFDMGNTDKITVERLGLPAGTSFIPHLNTIAFMRGMDVRDDDGDGVLGESRKSMGAAPHGLPAVVTYGTDEATATQVIYAPTNDGMLHAIDAETGQELWAFFPLETMKLSADLYQVPDDPYIGYGLDGSIIAHSEEIGGVERKRLYFGMRRGGKSIYALDVTDKNAPEVLWRIQGGITTGFEKLAQTWSDPRVARIAVDGTPKTVLIFGGGYDALTQDSDSASLGYIDDSAGNAVYVVDAETGGLLWRAGADTGADLIIADMKSSIAAPVNVRDKNEDGLADLLYAADLGGRIFRFDIDNANNTTASLAITGGMIASLGAEGNTSAALADNRKFFNQPDVVLVAGGGETYWAINLGSGDRERPKSNMTTQNYLFSIKDPNVFNTPGSYAYGITIDDLYDATSNDIQEGEDPAGALTQLKAAKGWKVLLEKTGEKALAQAKTFDYRVFFTTFDPTPLDSTACNSDPGTARLYTLDLRTAAAVTDLTGDEVLTKEDRVKVLTHGTVPPAVTLMFLEDEATGNIEAVQQIGRSDERGDVGNTSVVRRTSWNVETNDDSEQ